MVAKQFAGKRRRQDLSSKRPTKTKCVTQCLSSGVFAADMRLHVGGYGRGDKRLTYRSEQDYSKKDLTSLDKMEEGSTQNVPDNDVNNQGASRATLRRMKSRMKKHRLEGETSVKHDDQKNQPIKSLSTPACTSNIIDRVTVNAENTADMPITKKKKMFKSDKKSALSTKKKISSTIKKTSKGTDIVDRETDHTFEARSRLSEQYEAVFGSAIITKSGLKFIDAQIGDGQLPKTGDAVTVRYRARLDDKDGLLFNKGILSVRYGTKEVIPGWDEAMGTMRPGGLRLATIPPELAYGSAGKGEKIPPNSTLYFEIELIRIASWQPTTQFLIQSMASFWAAKINPQKSAVVKIPADHVLTITNVARSILEDDASSVSVGVETKLLDQGTWKGAVCHFDKTVHQSKLDLVFSEEVKFYIANGSESVNLTGYFQSVPCLDKLEETASSGTKKHSVSHAANTQQKQPSVESSDRITWDQTKSSSKSKATAVSAPSSENFKKSKKKNKRHRSDTDAAPI